MHNEQTNLMKQHSTRSSFLRKWLIRFVVFSVTVAGILIVKCGLDWPAFADSVPLPIQNAAKNHSEQVGRADVHTLLGSFIDVYQVWRVEVSPEVVTSLVAYYDLRKIPSSTDVPAAFWRHWPYWWRPPRGGSAQYYISANFDPDNRGRDGNHFLIAYDKANKVLYVWNKDNF